MSSPASRPCWKPVNPSRPSATEPRSRHHGGVEMPDHIDALRRQGGLGAAIRMPALLILRDTPGPCSRADLEAAPRTAVAVVTDLVTQPLVPPATCAGNPAVLAATTRPANCLAAVPGTSGRLSGRALPSRQFPAHPGPGSQVRGRALAAPGHRRHLRRRRRSMFADHPAARRSADHSMALGDHAGVMAGFRSSGQLEPGPLSRP